MGRVCCMFPLLSRWVFADMIIVDGSRVRIALVVLCAGTISIMREGWIEGVEMSDQDFRCVADLIRPI